MISYIIRRLIWMIPIILCVAVLVFTIMFFCPGDPALVILGQGATDVEIANLREAMGLNRGYLPRLAEFMTNTFIKFDLGTSYISKTSIAAEIGERLPRTVVLATLCSLISLFVGVPLGVIAAVKQDSLTDRLCMIMALVGISIPNFWLALELVIIFSVKLGWLPAMGMGGVKYYILPTLSMCFGGIAVQARQTRSSMLEVIRSEYITTARSKGVSPLKVILKHELPNALIPVITIVGTSFAGMLGGAMIIEQIFGIPGMGTLLMNGVFNRDYPVVQTGTVFLATVFSLMILLIDIAYAFIDPRIKAQYEGKPLFKSRKAKVNANEE